MSAERDADPVKAARAIAWPRGPAAVCDSIEPWDHGHVVRASRFPDYWDYNVVRVEEDPAMSTDELVDFAVAALEGLAHVRIDFDDVDSAAEHEGALVARGWQSTRLVSICARAGAARRGNADRSRTRPLRRRPRAPPDLVR